MNPGMISLIAVTVGFIALVAWVYAPSRKARMESYASIPLADEPEAPPPQEEQSQ